MPLVIPFSTIKNSKKTIRNYKRIAASDKNRRTDKSSCSLRLMNTPSIDEKWEIVRSRYESAYKIKFKARPSDDKIEFLYAEMQKLSQSLDRYLQRAQTDIERFLHSPSYRKKRYD